MITREMEPVLTAVSQQFKAVVITGPRQSGKTTLARMAFPDKPYVSLESPDERERATRDPRLFLSRFPEGCILDEIQRTPDLFSYLQGDLDAHPDNGTLYSDRLTVIRNDRKNFPKSRRPRRNPVAASVWKEGSTSILPWKQITEIAGYV